MLVINFKNELKVNWWFIIINIDRQHQISSKNREIEPKRNRKPNAQP
jgi:hypothetical protein